MGVRRHLSDQKAPSDQEKKFNYSSDAHNIFIGLIRQPQSLKGTVLNPCGDQPAEPRGFVLFMSNTNKISYNFHNKLLYALSTCSNILYLVNAFYVYWLDTIFFFSYNFYHRITWRDYIMKRLPQAKTNPLAEINVPECTSSSISPYYAIKISL